MTQEAHTATVREGTKDGTGCSRVVRVQDRDGRGPWRPGFSQTWVRDDSPWNCPPIFSEIPAAKRLMAEAHKAGKHLGCAVRSSKMDRWFSAGDLARLRELGFRVVSADACEVLAEGGSQLLIASPFPLSWLPEATT